MKAHLKVIEGKPLGASIPLAAGHFLIGRDASCQLRPKHESVGPRHCKLSIDGDRVWVRDLGSVSGTILNGRRLSPEEKALATHGDHIQVGNLVFELTIPVESAAAAPERSPSAAVSRSSMGRPQAGDYNASAASSAMFSVSLDDDGEDNSPSSSAYRLIQRSLAKSTDPIQAVGTHLIAQMSEGIPWITVDMPRITSETNILHLKRELRNLAERPTLTRVILDFRKVKEISPEAVDVLINFHKRMEARGASLKLCDLVPDVMKVMDQKEFTLMVPVHLDCRDAVWSNW